MFIAAQDLKAVAEIRRLIVIFSKLYYNWLTVGLCAAKAAVCAHSHAAFVYVKFLIEFEVLYEYVTRIYGSITQISVSKQ